MVSQYNLDDYTTIQSAPDFDHQLPPSIHSTIQKLIKDLDIPINTATQQTPIADISQTNRNHFRERHSPSSSLSSSSSKFRKPRNDKSSNIKKGIDTTWEKQAEFIATKIQKKEGIEKLINEIRVSLNKISTKNYETHRDTIFKNINDIIDDEANYEEDIKKIATAIFEIASTNKFYSELYATLYKELIDKHPIFNNILNDFISTSYLNNISRIEYVDEKKDYDKFCLMNKENDKRKAVSVFIVNLMKKELITKIAVIDIILHLQGLVISNIDESNKNYVIEEITENISLLITTSAKTLIDEQKWNTVTENIQTCSQLKVKEHQSISSRAIFKYKDIVDFMHKKI